MAWLVDGMNVIGTRPSGWWRDRRAAMEALVQRLDELASSSGEDVSVVFDGRARPISSSVRVHFAPGGPNAADDAIAGMVARHPRPETLRVVTSDRRLAEAVAQLGASVESAGAFLRRLDELSGPPRSAE